MTAFPALGLDEKMNEIIRIRKVYKRFLVGGSRQTILHDISMTVKAGEFVAIVGPSGNGKSTLLNLLTGIDRPCEGEVIINGKSLHGMSEEQLSIWRGPNVGIVFQFFQLLPSLNLLQNVMLPMDFVKRLSKPARRERALHLLEQVDLANCAEQLPSQVSGGQQQRAAIARALANDPPLIVADEPTGNLDAQTADDVFRLFAHLADLGKTLVMVTHNEELAQQASRRVEIRMGRIHSDRETA
jgi:putative ABC transport system ATP-binding protein